MREIKFRAWLNMQEEMLYANIYGAGELFAGRDCEIMQYTGLKDKNGKEIYEGDILRRWINSRGTTYPSNSKIHMILVSWNKNSYNIKPILMDRLEIIGNIHENAELLSGNK